MSNRFQQPAPRRTVSERRLTAGDAVDAVLRTKSEWSNGYFRRFHHLARVQRFLHDGMMKRDRRNSARNHAMRAGRDETRPAVRATRLPHNPVLVAKKHRPKGYWKHKYIEKQETHPGKVAAIQEQALEVAQRSAAVRVPKPYVVGRTLATLHPPPAPSLFQRDWLRSLLCEGCGLPATTNTTKCLHCNVVVHNWCRDLLPAGARPKRSGRRSSSIAIQKQQQQQQLQQLKLTQAQKGRITALDWVCWECQEDMLLDLQYYRRLKNRQMGANVEKRAAGKIIRFITWVADYNNAIKAERRAIMIQSFVRMRVVHVRYRVWAESQKRAMIVSVRGASGLPVGDPVSRKCQPYIILTVIESSKDDPGQQVQTSHRLQTKKVADTGPSVTTAAAAAIAHNHSHHGAPSSHPPHGGGARKHPNAEKTFSFQWDEELLLPGVADSATIVFTLLHQAPTKVVCLGQALVVPKKFSRNEEHVRTVPLTKQQVAITSGPRYRGEEARMTNADWGKPGNLTFMIKKSSYCDAHCSEVNGPIVEEITTLALAESYQEGRRRDVSGAGPAAVNVHKDPHTAAAATNAAAKQESQGRSRRHPSGGNVPAHDKSATPQPLSPSPPGAAGRTNANRVHKTGDLSTVWWACVWQGHLRVYRSLGDSNPKLSLPLDRWSLAPAAEAGEEEDANSGRTASRDLRLFCAFPKRWLVLRCETKTDKERWEAVIIKNQGSSSTAQRKTRGSLPDQAAAAAVH